MSAKLTDYVECEVALRDKSIEDLVLLAAGGMRDYPLALLAPRKTSRMKTSFTLLVSLYLLQLPFVVQAAEKGYLGIAVAADGEGLFNPTLKTLTVKKVIPNSPAAKVGIELGDEIVEIEGRKVAGAKANDLKPLMEVQEGQTLRIAIKKQTGATTVVSVVLGRHPN